MPAGSESTDPRDGGTRPGPRWTPAPFELGTDGPSVVLVGVDGSDTSLRAAAFALGQARRQHARLLVVYVRERFSPLAALGAATGSGAALVASYGIQDQIEAELRTSFDQIVGRSGMSASFVVRHGDPFSELTAVAHESGADSVIVGSSTRAGHRIAGSLAVRLVRAGRWPVTVVP